MEVSHFTLPLYVIKTNAPPLFRREWLKVTRLNWPKIHKMSARINIDQVLQRHDSLLNSYLGKFNRIETKLNLKAEAKPVFHKARSVPFAKKSKISENLNLLESQGIVEKVWYCEWAAPIVAVDKRDGRVRTCGDFKVTDKN